MKGREIWQVKRDVLSVVPRLGSAKVALVVVIDGSSDCKKEDEKRTGGERVGR